jgi:hypothetical protein
LRIADCGLAGASSDFSVSAFQHFSILSSIADYGVGCSMFTVRLNGANALRNIAVPEAGAPKARARE